MRSPNDYGLSPNMRYAAAPKRNRIPIGSTDAIRMLADYNKVRPVTHAMILIQHKKQNLWFTITDKVWVHRLNNNQLVRVRMFMKATNMIYLFDPVTDTYLTSVKRTIDTFGDKVNMTEKDMKRIMAHANRLKAQEKYRQRCYDKAMEDGTEATDTLPELPSSLTAAGCLTLGAKEEREEYEVKEEDSEKENSTPAENERESSSPSVTTTNLIETVEDEQPVEEKHLEVM